MMQLSILMITSLCLVSSTQLLANEANTDDSPLSVNRLDFTAAYLDNINSDNVTGLFSYTRNLSKNSNLGVRGIYLDSRFRDPGGTGIGDTTLTWSFLPSADLSVQPWVPRVVGSGVSVTLPTGNESQGRGLGSTIITPFIGTVFSLTDTFYISPNLAYAYSVDPIVNGKDVRIAVLEIGFTWVLKSGWWVSLYPGYVKDYEAGNTTTGGRLSAGKVFESGWGLSAHYIDLENFTPGMVPAQDGRFSQVYELSVNYTF